MLKFVEKWLRERADEKEIEKYGTTDKWTKCEEGLPSSDRRVEAMVYHPGRTSYIDRNVPAGMNICFAQFNPHVGWQKNCEGVVIAWRDMDKEFRDLANDLEWAKNKL